MMRIENVITLYDIYKIGNITRSVTWISNFIVVIAENIL